MNFEEKKRVVEAALFASERPISLSKIAKLINSDENEALFVLQSLKKELEDKSLDLVETKLGYEIRIKPQYREYIKHIATNADISPGMARTLGLIILNEPVKQSDLVKIQGNKVYDYVKKLEERGLIKTKQQGRTKIIYLTKELEAYFGMKKEALKSKIKEEL